MKTYDPNVRFANNKVELTYQQWDYTAKAVVDVGGNCKGLDILEYAVGRHFEMLTEENPYPEFFLKRPAEDGDGEDTLGCDLVKPEELAAMLVSARIIEHVSKDTEE